MNVQTDFAQALAACFDYDNSLNRPELEAEIANLLAGRSEPPRTRNDILDLHKQLEQKTGGRKIALVYGGATKIKDYVFEAPKLPEIRGASAILDWANGEGLRQLWHQHLDGPLRKAELVERCIVYASGGNLLAVAPYSVCVELGLPDQIEQMYTCHTLSAQSAAVMLGCSLIELRYGREPWRYWLDDLIGDWGEPRKRDKLRTYLFSSDVQEKDDYDPALLEKQFLERRTFNELVTLLSMQFYRRREEQEQASVDATPTTVKRQPREIPRYELISWAQKCATSDVRSAVVVAPPLPGQPTLSESSARKAYIGRKVKRPGQPQSWFTDVFDWRLEPLPTSWEDSFLRLVEGSEYSRLASQRKAAPAQDVGEIAQASQAGRYIGLIYADGNNVARYMGQTTTPDQFAERAKKLTREAEHAVFTALAKHLTPTLIVNEQGVREWVHPFEIVTIGGDDMLLVVPGDKALAIALEISVLFEQRMGRPEPRQIHDRYSGATLHEHESFTPTVGLSAGVVIAQENTPFFFLRDLVEQLLKNAKRHARGRSSTDLGGAVDFMVLKSITMVVDDVTTFRKQALGDGDLGQEHPNEEGKIFRRTARPYTWHELDGLLKTARELQREQFPRSQLYRLRGALDTADTSGVLASSLEYLATRSRFARSSFASVLLRYVEGAWRSSGNNRGTPTGAPPWLRLPSGGYETIWPDLAEIYEFVGPSAAEPLTESAHA